MKKITAAVFTLCLLLLCAMPCFAFQIGAEQPADDVSLTTQVPDSHTLTVSVKNGVVSYEGNDGKSFEIPRHSQFALDIQTDSGYRIKRITLDGTDVTDLFKEGTLTLSGICDEAQLYVITEKIGGTYEVDNPDPKPGDKVTITPTPDEGYEIEGITVKDEEGKEIEVTDNGDGTYSYIQPEGEVEIEAEFAKKPGTGSPETGDSGSLALWMALMLVSAATLAGTALSIRKREYNR